MRFPQRLYIPVRANKESNSDTNVIHLNTPPLPASQLEMWPAPEVATSQRRRPQRWLRVFNQLLVLVIIIVRMFFGLIIATLTAPVLAPALLMLLPDCILVRELERMAVRAIRIITAVSGVKCVVGAKCDALGFGDLHWAWLSPPVVRVWKSLLLRGHTVITYDQPGRWMSDDKLYALYEELHDIAAASMDTVPVHRLFDTTSLRSVYSNRIVSIAYDNSGIPLGFTALVYLPYNGSFVVHLGLTMIRQSARGSRLQTPLFSKCVFLPVVNHCRLAYTVTNIAASPAGIGNLADYLVDTFPHYDGSAKCKPYHLDVARHVLRYYRHEFGCSRLARFDANTFVVHRSNAEEGGGASAFIKEDGKPVSRHRNPVCNAFVRKMLNLAEGDELFQVCRLEGLSLLTKCIRRGIYLALGKKPGRKKPR